MSRTSGTWYYVDGVWSSTDPRTPAQSTAITLTSSSSTTVGQSIALASSVTYNDGTTKQDSLTWSVSDSTVASLSSTTGTSVNLTAIKAGTVTVTATNGTITSQKTITIAAVAPTAITLTSSSSTTVGQSIALSSSVTYSDGTTKQDSLTWSVSDSSVASLSSTTGTTVNLTALKAGTVTVTATNGTLTTQKTITISDVSTNSIKVYFQSSWSTNKIYYWSTVPAVTAVAWPGVDMTSEGNGWYSYTLNGATSTNLIFNNGSGSKTADLSITSGTWYYSNNAWTDKDPRIDTTAPTITASPSAGKVEATSLSVTLTVKDNVDTSPKVYYTTDGTDPIVGTNLYTGSHKV